MAKFTRKQRRHLEAIKYHLERADRYVRGERVVICAKDTVASTTLHLQRSDGLILYPVDKEIGSDITGLYEALRQLKIFLDEEEV